MVASDDTLRRLAAITDPGKFERLATAVLRLGDPIYRCLGHTGINAAGRTVKSPVDNMGFVRGAEPPHMVMAHHTVTDRDGLEQKWLHNPTTVKPRNPTGKPTAPAGDLVKSIEIAREQAQRMPGLRTTLALTCSVEPREDLVRRVVAEGHRHGIVVDVWSASRIASILDDDAAGQWLRQQHLGIRQERLSLELLGEIARTEAERRRPLDDASTRVDRAFDSALANAVQTRSTTFVVASAGLGKSVACHKLLLRHLQEGGYGLVVSHEVIESAGSLEDAVEATLRRAAPELAPGCGAAAFAIGNHDAPLLLVIEDVNRANRPEAILERLISWMPEISGSRAGATTAVTWRLLCPIWPRWIDRLGDDARKHAGAAILLGREFLPTEGIAALLRRAEVGRLILLPLEAERLSAALGHDPLLIGLHEFGAHADPMRAIAAWIAASVARLAAGEGSFTAPDYIGALDRLAQAMLSRRNLLPVWSDVVAWFSASGDQTLGMLRDLVQRSELIRLGPAQELLFRHDRVRDEVLVATAAAMMASGALPDSLWAEPYVAHILGWALAREGASAASVSKARALNPLALFHAFAAFPIGSVGGRKLVVDAIEDWLAQPETRGRAHSHCRSAALGVLADVEGPEVLALLDLFGTRSDEALQAAFRNGDLTAGYELCLHSPPGFSDSWRDRQIAHAAARFGQGLVTALEKSLREPGLEPWERIAALRLAGFLGDPALAGAVAACWKADPDQARHLRDHLWAAMRCADDCPDRLLQGPCDLWASLSDEHLPDALMADRDEIAAHELAFAVRQAGLPDSALDYLDRRAEGDPALRSQIALMLRDVDHPVAAVVCVKARARIAADEGQSIKPDILGRHSGTEWVAAFGIETRARLEALWTDSAEHQSLRHAAFNVWERGRGRGDLTILRAVAPQDSLADAAMAARLRRGDHDAVPTLVAKLQGKRAAFWWQLGRDMWSDALTEALDIDIGRVTAPGASIDPGDFWDRIVPELLARLPDREAERILEKHWDGVSDRSAFVCIALFIANPRLIELVRATMAASPEPTRLLSRLALTFATINNPRGVTARRQIEHVLPYLALLDSPSLTILRNICADRGWHDLGSQIDASQPTADRSQNTFDENDFRARLDQMAGTMNAVWLNKMLDDYLGKTRDVTPSRLLGAMLDWAGSRSTIEAIELAAAAVCHVGNRGDAGRLAAIAATVSPRLEAEAIAADTRFAVELKGLS